MAKPQSYYVPLMCKTKIDHTIPPVKGNLKLTVVKPRKVHLCLNSPSYCSGSRSIYTYTSKEKTN